MQSILYRLGLQDMVIFYASSTNLRRTFAPSKSKLKCETNCVYCPMMKEEGSCLKKFIIYCITCIECNKKYIGQTERFFKTLLQEHFNQKQSAVYKHTEEQHDRTNVNNIYNMYACEILHNNLRNKTHRIETESQYIQRNSSELMNGCVSTYNIL